MQPIINNLSAHVSVRLMANTPFVEGLHPKTQRAIKYAKLSEGQTIAEFTEEWFVESYEGNTTGINPMVTQEEGASIVEVLGGISITRNVGGTTTVTGLPEPKEGHIFLTSIVTATAAKRADVISPNTIADPATGFAIGAIGYIAFG